MIFRQRGHRAIAQRLTALGSRLAVEPHRDDGKVESALSYLEEVTGAAHNAVSESSAESVRLRRSLDSLPLGLVLCDETGGVIFRNTQAEQLMASRYGDAIAAQAVTDVLAEGWANGVAERTIDIYGPPRRTLTIRATVIDDGRRSLGVLAIIEDVSERRRLEDIRRDFIANVSHELKTPMGALGLLAETLQFERDPAVAQRLAERINIEAFRVNRIIEDLLDLSRIEGEGSPSREPISPCPRSWPTPSNGSAPPPSSTTSRSTFEEPEANHVVFGDRRQLISALHALLENARRLLPARRHRHDHDRPHRRHGDATTARPPDRCVHDRDPGPGRRHPREGPRADLRTLLPRRSRSSARDRRHRARPQHRAPRGPEPRRHACW